MYLKRGAAKSPGSCETREMTEKWHGGNPSWAYLSPLIPERTPGHSAESQVRLRTDLTHMTQTQMVFRAPTTQNCFSCRLVYLKKK